MALQNQWGRAWETRAGCAPEGAERLKEEVATRSQVEDRQICEGVSLIVISFGARGDHLRIRKSFILQEILHAVDV